VRSVSGRGFPVCHIITRWIVGGAQENTLLSVAGFCSHPRLRALLVSGSPSGPEGNLLEEAQKRGIPMRLIPSLVREVRPLRDLRAFWEIYRLLRAVRPRIVHTHSAKGGVLGRFAARCAGIPSVVHTFHGPVRFPHRAGIWSFLSIGIERLLARQTDAFVAVSEELCQEAVEARLCSPDRIRCVYSGLELSAYRPDLAVRREIRGALGISADATVVVKVARMFHGKGHLDLVEAFGRVAGRFPGAVLLLVGDGILRGKVEERVRALGLAGRVFFPGLVAPEEIPRWLNASDILAHCSLREGLPRVTVQAGLMGLPCVAYRAGGVAESVAHGCTGLLLPPGDRRALESALALLLGDPAKGRLWGGESCRGLADRFAVDRMWAALGRLYEELLDPSGRAS
jgi:glycosyltransferase involved in cell wall biosynthesis